MTRTLFAAFIVLSLICGPAQAQFGDDTPDRPEERAPAPPGVKPVIPLNKNDPTYDLWKKRRDDLQAGREPGPIAIQRYPGGFIPMGIPTFFRLPVALTPEDLKVGGVDRLVRECLVGLALRKKGVTEEHYLSPLTVNDGRE